MNDIIVPGTLGDSLVLLAVVEEQHTDLQPTQLLNDDNPDTRPTYIPDA